MRQRRNESDDATRKRYRDATARSRVKAQIRNMEAARQELIARGGTCIHPGCSQTYVEWHHRDPAEKSVVVSMLIRNGSAIEKVKAELAKCDPLCPQHHRAELLVYHKGISQNAEQGPIGLRHVELLAEARAILLSEAPSYEVVQQLRKLLC